MRKKIHQIFISAALVTIFLSYYAGATLFSHTHQYEWGKVTHSHPYVPSASHSHTSAALQTLDSLTNLLFILTASLVAVTSLTIVERNFAPISQDWRSASTPYASLRAPPVVY